ncbi:MAG TPA: nucleoside hydrolase [Acidobacteriaceae bacterium]|nr:nucleoside hydrolase [Acidobacteriaceae bacterium]
MTAAVFTPARALPAQSAAPDAAPEKVILDTDIGDDIDDAFALALLLSSPKVQLLGVTTAWGDTDLRARLVARFLAETGHSDIPVAAGPATKASSTFSQRRYAEAIADKPWPNGAGFLLDQIRRYPGQITLIGIAPFSTVGAAIRQDPATFRQLKRIVIMGGSIHRRYGDLGYLPDRGPEPEYNIDQDIPSSRKLFASGVPLYVMPLDSTQLKLDEVLRSTLFSQGTRTTDALTLLYQQWADSTGSPTPTLFDAMAVAYALDPSLCPTTPMRIRIDDAGSTVVVPGEPNANVCLQSDSDRFFHFYIPMVLGERAAGH